MNTTPATDRQTQYIQSLLNGIDPDNGPERFLAFMEGNPSKADASTLISTLLKEQPAKKPQSPTPATNARPTALQPGFYRNANGETFEVFPSRNGYLLAKRLDTNTGKFEYIGGVSKVKNARPLTLEEAKEYGRLTGRCMMCGRTLTDPNSIEQGIGPICAQKF